MKAGAAARATARYTFEAVGERLQVDADLLAYLFTECLEEILAETAKTQSCTLRGTGKFRSVTLSALLAEEQSPGNVTVFERTKHQSRNKPFAALQLARRMRE